MSAVSLMAHCQGKMNRNLFSSYDKLELTLQWYYRKQSTLPDPEGGSGALINVAKRLEKLFRAWEKIRGIIKNRKCT